MNRVSLQRQAILGGIIAIGLYLTQVWLFSAFNVDDVFITFRFVKQWNAGSGLVYNVGEFVEGYSNFLWIALLAPLDRLNESLVTSAKLVGVTLGLLTLGVTCYTTQRWRFPWIATLLLASTPAFAVWSVSGLETPLFTFLLLSATTVFLYEEKQERGWASGILFALLALTRPEGLMFGAVTAFYRAMVLFRERRRPAVHDYARLLSWLLPVTIYYLWRWQYYGYWLPNTMYAKSMGFHVRAILEGIYYLYGGVNAFGGLFFFAIPLVGILMKWRFPSQAVLLLQLIFAQFALILVSGGDWMPFWRFWVHILPLAYLLIHQGLVALGEGWPKPTILVPLLVIGQCIFLLIGAFDARFVQGIGAGAVLSPPSAQVTYLVDHVEPEDTIAVIDAGRVAYELPLSVRIVDMVGLTDQHIAHIPPQFPGGLSGRGDAFGKWDIEYVLSQEPRFIQVNITSKREGSVLTNFTGTTLLVNHPVFRRSYGSVDAPGVDGLFVRQGAVPGRTP